MSCCEKVVRLSVGDGVAAADGDWVCTTAVVPSLFGSVRGMFISVGPPLKSASMFKEAKPVTRRPTERCQPTIAVRVTGPKSPSTTALLARNPFPFRPCWIAIACSGVSRASSRASWTPRPLPSLDVSQTVPDGFETLLRSIPRWYHPEVHRKRISQGIKIPPGSKLTFEDAVIFVWIVACMAMWNSKLSSRAALLRDATSQSRIAWRRKQPRDQKVAKSTKLHGKTGLKQIEAHAALGFALSAGYTTHSWELWKCLLAALQTDALAPRSAGGQVGAEATKLQVDGLFKQIRDRLNTASKKSGQPETLRKAHSTWKFLRDMPFSGKMKNRWAHPSTWNKRYGET